MYNWFQNLNNNPNFPRLFHFRGKFGRDYNKTWVSYEFASGPNFHFEMKPYNDCTKFIFGFFFFTMYLTIYNLRIPWIKKGRMYGFNIIDWEVWIHIANKPMEIDSRDPWYHTIVIKPLDLLFGKTVYFTKEWMKNYSPVYFYFRGKEYCMDSIKINDSYWFRSRIPFGLYKSHIRGMQLDIKKPPGHAGKGENSWDCGDDAIYGISRPYDGPEASWKNEEAVFKHCCKVYCYEVMKNIRRYGRASDDRELPGKTDLFKYIGHKPIIKGAQNG
jgi:hypothetical protein